MESRLLGTRKARQDLAGLLSGKAVKIEVAASAVPELGSGLPVEAGQKLNKHIYEKEKH